MTLVPALDNYMAAPQFSTSVVPGYSLLFLTEAEKSLIARLQANSMRERWLMQLTRQSCTRTSLPLAKAAEGLCAR